MPSTSGAWKRAAAGPASGRRGVGSLDEDVDRPADPGLVLLPGDRGLDLHDLAAARLLLLEGDPVGQAERGGASLGRVGENAEVVEPGRLRRTGAARRTLSSFARKADDERGPDRRVRELRPDAIEEPERPGPVEAPPHGFDEAGIGMLEGDVEVAADLRTGHRLEQAVRDLLGIAVEEAQPGDAGDTREPLQEPGEPVPDPTVAAEPGRVVGDEVDLPDAESRERPDLAQDRGRAPRDVRAFDQRDGAETAAVGTPLRDLDVGPGAGRRDQPGRRVRIEEGPARLAEKPGLRRSRRSGRSSGPRSRRRPRGIPAPAGPGPFPRDSRRRRSSSAGPRVSSGGPRPGSLRPPRGPVR